MGTNKIENVGTPTDDNDAATKKYVDDNAGGHGSHLQKFHTDFLVPTPDSGTDYKVFTNNGFWGQKVFEMSSRPFVAGTTNINWKINMPNLFFQDNLVTFYLRFFENNTLTKSIEVGATYNGFVGSGYLTYPAITHGSYTLQNTTTSNIFRIDVTAKPIPLNETAKLYLAPAASINQMDRVFDVEAIEIEPR